MFYVYLLKSRNKKWIYIGCTNDLKKRFNEHNVGKVISTKSNKPYKLIYYEAYDSNKLAREREIKLKKHSQEKEILYKRLGL